MVIWAWVTKETHFSVGAPQLWNQWKRRGLMPGINIDGFSSDGVAKNWLAIVRNRVDAISLFTHPCIPRTLANHLWHQSASIFIEFWVNCLRIMNSYEIHISMKDSLLSVGMNWNKFWSNFGVYHLIGGDGHLLEHSLPSSAEVYTEDQQFIQNSSKHNNFSPINQ